jgi:hypothetical protein
MQIINCGKKQHMYQNLRRRNRIKILNMMKLVIKKGSYIWIDKI